MNYRYREKYEMKDSGVDWFGKIPKNWEIKKTKYIFDKIQTGTTPSSSNEKFFKDGDINWFTPGDIKDDCLIESNRKVTKLALEKKEVKEFYGDSIIVVGIGATAGKVAFSSQKLTFNQQLTGFYSNKNINKFYFYLMKYLGDDFFKLATYTTLPILNNEFFKKIDLVSLDIKEQQKIVNFLDKKSEELDSIIVKKENLIIKLEEAKKSLISEVVTGKLKIVEKDNKEYKTIKRQEQEMVNSGIKWIGMIPKEWTIKKIKYNTYVKGRIGWQGLKSNEFIEEGSYLVTGTDFEKNKINWNSCYRISEDRFKEAPAIHLKNGDLLITKDGTIGKLAIVENCPKQAVLNSGIFVTRCTNNDYLTKYMFYILDSKIFSVYIDINKTGSTIAHLYQETFMQFSYPLPNKNIQENIIRFLDKKINKFDLIIEKQKQVIQKLKEAKQSLISEAVTGKIEVLV
ncbi:MAG: restriction endonuclease subunit S [Cetobacterium sp.]|uniref:restriction endonuclease subunit S n=1 Tax=Cetobacterium sp. TaxID=2071632 RepID=UPI0025C3C239|nr:restriction endonuclease subunit S [Cetobacterium sp.]